MYTCTVHTISCISNVAFACVTSLHCNLPSHELPFPVNPSLHMHSNEPSILLQEALESQIALLLVHSSVSGIMLNECINKYMLAIHIHCYYMLPTSAVQSIMVQCVSILTETHVTSSSIGTVVFTVMTVTTTLINI